MYIPKFKSIKNYINFILIITVILSITIMTFTVIYHVSNRVKEDYQNSIDQQLEVLTSEISLYIDNIKDNTKMLSEFPTIKSIDDRITSYKDLEGVNNLIEMLPDKYSDFEVEVNQILKIMQSSHQSLLNASVGVESNGGFVKYPPSPRFEGYDARERSWYQAALINPDQVTIPGVYVTSSNENVILCVSPVKNNKGNIVGVVSVDFNLSELSKTINSVKIGKSGYVLLTGKTGLILSHPNDVNAIGELISNTEYSGFVNGNNLIEGSKSIVIDGKEFNVECRKLIIPDLELYYFVSIESDEYYISARRVTMKIIVTAVVIIMIVLLLIKPITNRLVNSLVTLTNFSVNLSKGELSERVVVKRDDEIGQLSDSLNLMAKSLEESQNRLEKQVEERTVKLNETNVDLRVTNDALKDALNLLNVTQAQLIQSEKLAGLGSMISGLAHEINTPIGITLTTSTYTLSLLKNLQDKYEENTLSKSDLSQYIVKANESFELSNQSLKKAIDLVERFKLVSAKQVFDKEANINVMDEIKSAIVLYSNQHEVNLYKINLEGESNQYVNSYSNALRQVFHHLIENTLKYAYVDSDEKVIDILVESHDEFIIISYQDYGIGINQEEIDRIFEPFYTNYRHEGCIGLGLNIVYNIIKFRLEGDIEVTSSIDHGVKYIIKLPNI